MTPDPAVAETRAVERLAWRLAELTRAFGVSRRTIERERSAGRFPPPDLHIGKAPLWTPATIRRWIGEQASGRGVRK